MNHADTVWGRATQLGAFRTGKVKLATIRIV